MPQMAPMYWLILFFYFLGIFLLFIINMYYFSTPPSIVGNKSNLQSTNSFNWLW
nr:ATP synthase F0 subunit 8 [Procloeon bifidum]